MIYHQTLTTKYLLGTLLFSSINSFTMNLDKLPNNNPAVVNSNNYATYTVTNPPYHRHPTITCPIDEYKAEYKNKISHEVDAIRDTLDAKLGINTHSYLRPLTGSIMSYYETTNLSRQQICQKINDLESYLAKCPANMKKQIFKTLFQCHWYVHYLVKAGTEEHIKNFQYVTSSTLNQLLNPDFSNDISGTKALIHELALVQFIDKKGLKRPLEFVPYDKSGDIHFTILYAHTNPIQSKSMIMSNDGKYLKATDNSGCTIIWDTKEGIQTQSTPHIEWSSDNVPQHMHDCTMDATNTYAAFNNLGSGLRVGKNYQPSSIANMGQSALPVEIDKNKPAIILFKRPTLQSHLCQEAFFHSQDNSEQLSSLLLLLKNFKEIEGFPRKNLKELINNRIEELSTQQNKKAKI